MPIQLSTVSTGASGYKRHIREGWLGESNGVLAETSSDRRHDNNTA